MEVGVHRFDSGFYRLESGDIFTKSGDNRRLFDISKIVFPVGKRPEDFESVPQIFMTIGHWLTGASDKKNSSGQIKNFSFLYYRLNK